MVSKPFPYYLAAPCADRPLLQDLNSQLHSGLPAGLILSSQELLFTVMFREMYKPDPSHKWCSPEVGIGFHPV